MTLALDPVSGDCIRHFVWLFQRAGHAEAPVLEAMQEAWRTSPGALPPLPVSADREMPDAAHVMTLWFDDAAYLDSEGKPLALERRGDEPWFESLVRRVNPQVVDFVAAGDLR